MYKKCFVSFFDCFIALKLYAAAGEGQTKKYKNKNNKSARMAFFSWIVPDNKLNFFFYVA